MPLDIDNIEKEKPLDKQSVFELTINKANYLLKIEGPENDGRLTTSSSAALDSWQDMVENIDAEMRRIRPVAPEKS